MKHNKEKEDREKIAQKFFSQNKRSLYDIMPRGKDADTQDDDDEKETPEILQGDIRKLDLKEDSSDSFEPTINAKFSNRVRPNSNKYRNISLVSLVIVVLLGYYLFFILPEATVEVTLKQKPWAFNEILSASVTSKELPFQILSKKHNAFYDFPATGSKNVSRKAHGIIKVCNAFNSDAQALVATTRFQNSSNVIFRLDKGIVVPGATIADGKIQAKCIEAAVSSDAPGAQANVSPENKWVIPGFKGSAKFDSFYGVSEKAMSGGLIGNAKVPTASDISKAKLSAREKIRTYIEGAFVAGVPADIIIVQDSGGASTSLKIIKETVNEETDANGNFQYFIDAEIERIGLSKANVTAIAVAKAQAELGADFELKDSYLDLKLVSRTRDAKGTVESATVSVDFKGGFIKQVKEDEVKKLSAGKTREELTDFIPTDHNYKAHITLWPFWVSRVPSNQKKITAIINIEKVDFKTSGASVTNSSSTISTE